MIIENITPNIDPREVEDQIKTQFKKIRIKNQVVLFFFQNAQAIDATILKYPPAAFVDLKSPVKAFASTDGDKIEPPWVRTILYIKRSRLKNVEKYKNLKKNLFILNL